MRIWDINPGYLNRQSLLGEHRELHGIFSIITNKKKGYSKHPETIRWNGYTWALQQRHRQLVAEMKLRGFTDNSPISINSDRKEWPRTYVDEPFDQFQILKAKYIDKEQGRIPLPKNTQELWSHHKYSILARSVSIYKEIGRNVARTRDNDFSGLAMDLTELLREPPSDGGLRNTLQHMWGHVSDDFSDPKFKVDSLPLRNLLVELQRRVKEINEPYLTFSTALSELMVWLPNEQ